MQERGARWVLLCLLPLLGWWDQGMAQALAHAPIAVDSVRFRSFGVREGISQATARALLQDRRGFIWVGTQDGLNRFDGYQFRSYYRDAADPLSLSDHHVTALALNGDGRIWVGTMAGGVNLFDPDAGIAERFLPGVQSGLAGQQVMDLTLDAAGRLWVACAGGGLQRFDAASRRFLPPLELAQPAPLVRAIEAQPDGSLLIGSSHGVFRLDAQGVLSPLDAYLGAGEPAPDVWALATDAQGRLQVGLGSAGVLTLTADGHLLRHDRHHPQRPDSLPDDQVRALLHTRSGELWVGTMNGVAVRAPGADGFVSWRHDGADQAALAGNRTAALLEASDGLLWFGSWTGGISVHNPATRVLRNARHMSAVDSSLPRNPVRAMARDDDGRFWLGLLEGGGLVLFDRELGVVQRHLHDPADPRSLPNNNVQSVLRRTDGRLWVGTLNGVARLDADGGFTRFQHDPADPRSLASNSVVHMFEDGSGRLWIGSDDAGVSMQCAGCSDFQRYAMQAGDPHSIASNNLLSLAQGPGEQIWLGTSGGGLSLLDPHSGKARNVQAQPGVAGALNHNTITGITPAASGGWWVATQGGGVSRMLGDPLADPPQLRFSALTKADGLGADAIGAVIEDLDGFLWISTTVGISEYDPRTRAVRNLSASDGVDRAGYFINARHREADGTLFFGGLQGLVWFKPQKMRQPTAAGEVVFSELRLFDQPVQLRARDPQSPLLRSINTLDPLRLRHDQNVWSLLFSALHYAAPENTRYSYRLEGLHEHWSGGEQRIATFTGLPAGDYRFQVRASIDDGLSWGPELDLPVVILPAPWRSWPAYLAYAAALLLLGGWLLQRVRRDLRERERARQAIARSEERLKLALWGSRDELWDLDLNADRILRENPNPRVATAAEDSLHSMSAYLDWPHVDDRPALRQALQDHIEGRSEFYEASYRVPGVDADWVWLLGRGQAVDRDASGRAIRMVGTHRDISALKEAEEQLRRLNEELEDRVSRRTDALRLANEELSGTLQQLTRAQQRLIEAEKMASLGTLVAGVAHEINTPVGIGVTAASYLQQQTRQLGAALAAGQLSRSQLQAFSAGTSEAAQLILQNLERASQLIRSFKQVAVDQSSEERRQIQVGPYLQEVLFALGPSLKHSSHQISLDAPAGLEALVHPGALYQILGNLINNSLAHAFASDQIGHIRIQARRQDDDISLRYQDDGIGMSAEIVRRIFEPFFTTRRGQGGSGLGMHIVYNLVTRLLRGQILVQSSPGQGMSVDIRFPVR